MPAKEHLEESKVFLRLWMEKSVRRTSPAESRNHKIKASHACHIHRQCRVWFLFGRWKKKNILSEQWRRCRSILY